MNDTQTASMYPDIPFEPFKKIPRYRREIIITEKIDGTNAGIYVDEAGRVYPASRSRWISVEDDNFGFAKWVKSNEEELAGLGHGMHFGEWWGKGIQRGYHLDERRFSLFNAGRWVDRNLDHHTPRILRPKQEFAPKCCHVVPVLYEGEFLEREIEMAINILYAYGSRASYGYKNPEGIIIYHTAANICFKRTIEDDDKPKTKVRPPLTLEGAL